MRELSINFFFCYRAMKKNTFPSTNTLNMHPLWIHLCSLNGTRNFYLNELLTGLMNISLWLWSHLTVPTEVMTS